MKELFAKASELAEIVKKQKEVMIVTHIDADGITSGAIAKKTLDNFGIESKVKFVKQLEKAEIEKIKDENVFVWFTDLGSGQLSALEGIDFIITDHHVPEKSHRRQLNPHEFGIDGSFEMSGSVATLIVANRLFSDERLAELAIVGAVGDLQDSRYGKLVGFNRRLVEFLNGKIVEIQRDIRFFGKQTRPIAKMLEYNTDPIIPGITGDENGSLKFLSSLGVDPWKKWIEITRDEKRKIVSALVKHCMNFGMGYDEIKRIAGECYIFLHQPEACEKKDAMEFSTLLNATARYGEAEVGVGVCFGDEKAFSRARTLLQNHRKNLANGLRFVEQIGIREMKNVRYFHAGREIKDTIVGIIAGMSLVKNPKKPIVAFAESDNGVKVSARANYRLVDMGLNLSAAIKIAAEAVGGSGGGHSVAAGALIPFGSEEKFLKIFDELVGKQLKAKI